MSQIPSRALADLKGSSRRRLALRLASGFFDWSAAFFLMVAIFMTMDEHTTRSFAFLGAGLASTLLARFTGGLASDS